MSAPAPTARKASPHGWLQALVTVVAALVAMGVVAVLGLLAAGAADLPDNAFPRVAAATVVSAVGGAVELSGNAGDLVDTDASLSVLPLSVTLTGALAVARGFLRPLRHRAAAGTAELAGWAGRIAVLWLLGLLALAFAARQTFGVSLGDGALEDLGDLFGAAPRIGFTTDVPLTVLFGLLWLAGVLVLALLVARDAPLPGRLPRFQASVRPAAYAMVALLLAYVVVGVVIGLVVAATRGHPAQTFALLLLGLPNVAWLALTLGLGATWDGRVDGPFGLPLPSLLDEVLRTPDVSTLNLGTLAEHDGRAWWLLVVDVVLLLAAGYLAAVRSPAGTPAWRVAGHLGVALALTVLMIGLVCRISARYGLSVLGIGDLGGGLSGQLFLHPRPAGAVGLALLWGLVAGCLGALGARWAGRHGRRARR
ncbi:streptophobe family protein [Streptomyces sp. NPDC003717]|uniref:streptophobe family protein n=1 Tax=Streptomyces sp. NPDC003717 TaxID=3154276 RepID=UPI0033BA7C3A